MTCRVNDNLLILEGSDFQDLAPELSAVLHWLFRLQQNQTTFLTPFSGFWITAHEPSALLFFAWQTFSHPLPQYQILSLFSAAFLHPLCFLFFSLEWKLLQGMTLGCSSWYLQQLNASLGTSLVGPVVKNLPSNLGDMGLIPALGTKIPQAPGQLNPHACN